MRLQQMTTSNLLATNTVNLKTLLANGRIYHVPPYQRDYSWKDENWEDLWLDIEALKQEGNSQHYMGAIVLRGDNHPEHFLIIDGQQRIATLSILVLAVIARLEDLANRGHEPEANRERARLLRQSFVGSKDPGSLTETSKLSLNDNDDPFYQGTLIQLGEPASLRSLSDSEKLLWGAFKYYRTKISSQFEHRNGQFLADWINQTVSLGLLFIEVSVESEVSAYTVFETLNARGLELTASDLIKNYLMSLVASKGKGDLRYILNRWTRMTNHIGASRLPNFLRHYFNSVAPYVRQERLFREIRTRVTTGKDAVELVTELERAAICYRALDDANDEYWQDYPGAEEHVRALNLFNVSQFKPLILAAVRRLDHADVAVVLRDCVAISFRFNVISRLGTQELERRYNDAALKIELDGIRAPSDLRQTLRPVYVDDDQFRADFEVGRQATSTRGKRLLRYILCELERQFSGHDLAWHATSATVEHILPESLSEDWGELFSEETHQRYVDRLGNYALLERGKNKAAGQQKFTSKKAVYETSQYRLTQQLAESDEWSPSAIQECQRRLARLAATVWKLPS